MRFPFHSKIAGISHENDDGSSRQSIASSCRSGEPLILIRDRGNKYSADAIMVLRSNGQQLGFIREELAEDLTPFIDSGTTLGAEITEITGGGPDEYVGVNILIFEIAGLTTRSQSRPAADLSFLDGQAEQIESRRSHTLNRSFVHSFVVSIRRLFSGK
jgi:hypothetical protein